MDRPIELRIPDGRMAFGDVPEHIDERLQAAVKARGVPERCEELLWEAHRLGPRVLLVYYALYKYYFNRKRFADAERVAQIGLEAAAREGGFSGDWRTLAADSTAWTAEGPQRFVLFTLKALAFINLRRDRLADARAILDKLAEIDPLDQVGYGVIAALAKGVEGE
ncbi:hypothetical protein [Azospirillum canadense]|uniref:hypothetical protein n=1 Tax=Azospirillum canadense TaxID=403962 RepID=UPI0022262FD9|nr:hypothetical protein [Azospirillum canadense]MCW2236146.1 tetratricopeptide (TPR) repeat protein [Azospirillum canadense]